MKKIILVLCLLSIFVSSKAQESATKLYLNHKSLPAHLQHARIINPTTEVNTTTCGTDTIIYPYLKEIAFNAPSDSFFIDAMVGNVRTASQAYLQSGTVNVRGVQFWGGAYTPSTVPQFLNAKVYLYTVDSQNMPVTAIDSATVIVSENYDFYTALFSSPHPVSGNFAVGVRSNIANDTLAVVTNNAGASWQNPAYGESLAWRRYGSGSWNQSITFFGQDLEYMIFPIVDYTIDANFASSASPLCLGDAVNFANLSSPIFSSRMFNLRAFDQFWGFTSTDSTFRWNYGTNSTWTPGANGANTYAMQGTYTVTLAAEMSGYYNTCLDSMQMTIEVNPSFNMSFNTSFCSGDTLLFGNQTITTGGTYTETFQAMTGCDSIVELTVTANPVYNVSSNITICNETAYIFGTQTIDIEGVFVETFQSTTGCDSTVTLFVDVDTITTTISVNGSTLTADSVGTAYQWIDCDLNAALSGETAQSFTPGNSGNFAVIITLHGCTDTSECVLLTGVGLKGHNAEQSLLTVFPNPASNEITVYNQGSIPESIRVTNMIGETLLQTVPSAQKTILDLHEFSAGVYYITVTVNGDALIYKLIKQ